MSSLDEAVEQLRIKKAKQAYDLAELVMDLHYRRSTDPQKVYSDMVRLAGMIIAGT